MKQISISITVAVTMVCGALALTTSSASAATIHSAGTHVVTATMRLDCDTMSAKARRYAVAHGYCPAPGTRSPATTVSGDCGTSSIDIYNSGVSGTAIITYGFHSTRGTVVYRALVVGWAGQADADGWSDFNYMFSSSYNSGGDAVGTGVGEASATLSGTVTLWWGGKCTLLNPVSTANIT